MLKARQFILITGDILLAYLALFLTLTLRYFGNYSPAILNAHLIPFSIIYFFWLICFYIFGLYNLTGLKQPTELFKRMSKTFSTSLLLALAFFYLIPYFGITPKRNLFIVLLIFALLVYFWRKIFASLFSSF
ncbi:hypothetical protein FJ208_02680, partial [Candidatus Gribaldobacteria bacterium]|nr:hypothetical protein [Candidatus Gribaldobacteria bacterium]